MAQIESLYAQELEAEHKKVLGYLKQTQEEILKTNKLSIDFYGGKKSSNPNEFKSVTANYDALNKKVEQTTKTLEKQRLAEIKLQQDREKAFDKYDAQLQKEQAKLNASANLYNKVQTRLNALSNEYKNLGTKKELGIQLTDKEAQRYNFLVSKIQTYDKTLKAVDATMGKHQRNVGNYASGFNPLSNSINQLTREMPAFTYSVQTGFMALSNNIPIFTDAIGNAIQANKDLKAQGQPTTSVLKQLAGAFLSWQTLMGVGITLLTVYGKEIGEWIQNVTKGTKAVDSLKESQKQLNDINQQGAKNAVEETVKLKSLLAIAKDTSLSYKGRMVAVKELQDTYPAYLGNLTKEKILAGETAIAEKELTEAILSRAKANAAIEKITENQAKVIDVELERLRLRKEVDTLNKNILATEKQLQNSENVTVSQGIAASQMHDRRRKLISEINKLSGEKSELDKINNTLTDYAIEKEKESILLKYKDEKATKDLTKAKRDDVESVIAQGLKSQEYLQVLEEQLRLYKEVQSEVSSTSDEYKAFQNVIDGLQQSIDLIKDPSKVLTADVSGLIKQNEMYVKNREALLKLQEATDSWLSMFKTDFFQQMGLGSLNKFFDGTFDKLIAGADSVEEKFRVSFLAISEVAQEAFNIINQAGQASTQAEIDRLKIQYDTAWEFSDKSDVAKRKLDAERERREKEIAQKEFKRKQNMAVVNIGIDTAQAIMATYGQAGWIGGTAGAIFLGAMGLAQIALVKSQKMPEYYTGTENAKEGFALTQERGREIIKDKHGKIKSLGSDKGAQVTWLDSGDKVLNNQRTMQELMFDKDLNNILANNNITMPKIEMHTPKIDFSPVVDAINNQPIIIPDFDKLKTRIKRGNTIQTIEKAHTNFSSVKI